MTEINLDWQQTEIYNVQNELLLNCYLLSFFFLQIIERRQASLNPGRYTILEFVGLNQQTIELYWSPVQNVCE